MRYELSVTIPEKQWRKIFEKNFPDRAKIIAEYFFILTDTYGVSERAAKEKMAEIFKLMEEGHDVILRCPKGWKWPEEVPREVVQ